jgi:hypothetical protein
MTGDPPTGLTHIRECQREVLGGVVFVLPILGCRQVLDFGGHSVRASTPLSRIIRFIIINVGHTAY